MATAAQKAKHARSQKRYRQRMAGKKRQQESQFQPENMEHLTSGVSVENPENLPEVYQTRFPVTTTSEALLTTLEDMTSGALTMLQWLEDCDHLEAAEMVGAYQQLVNRMVKIRGEMEGGSQKATRFGKLTDARAEKMQQELALALGYGLTKFKHTYAWLVEHGLVDDLMKFRRHPVKGLAGILAGSATTIETWSAIRQWEERKNAKGSNAYIEAARAKRR